MPKLSDYVEISIGVLTWAVVFVLSMLVLRDGANIFEAVSYQLAILGCLLFVSSRHWPEGKMELRIAILLLFLALCMWLIVRIHINFFFIYTVVWISIAAYYFRQRSCWFWFLFITLSWFLVRKYIWLQEEALWETILVATFHVFALFSAQNAQNAKESNELTQELNRELLATQHLLSGASREAERTRIARDLHDLLGHHLTALTINLQLAGRLTEGEARDKVEQCHGLSKLLLSDVRDAVSTLRDAPAVDLNELLSLAIRDIPRLAIVLEVDKDIKLEDVKIAEVVLRVVQEAITNCLKHSHAKKLVIRVYTGAKSLHLEIEDDGVGAKQIVVGNGLTGMRERVEGILGTMNYSSQPNMSIEISIPVFGTGIGENVGTAVESTIETQLKGQIEGQLEALDGAENDRN